MPDSQPSPEAQFSAILTRFSPEIIALAKKCLTKLCRTVPHSHQVVYEYNHSVVVSCGLSEKGYEAIVTLAIYPTEVRLYFQGGPELPDPKGLLQGAGGKVRFVMIEAASDLDKADIKALCKAAIDYSGAKLPPAGSPQLIIKSSAKKKSAKKPKSA